MTFFGFSGRSRVSHLPCSPLPEMSQVDIYHWIMSFQLNSALLNCTLLLECNGFGLAGNTEKQSFAEQLLGERQRVILEHKNYVKQVLCQGVVRNEKIMECF